MKRKKESSILTEVFILNMRVKKLHELLDDYAELGKVKGLNNKIWIFLFGNVKININV